MHTTVYSPTYVELSCSCGACSFRDLGAGAGGRNENDFSLLKAVGHHTRDTLHTKLAEVYTLNKQYDDALESFHFAIRYFVLCWQMQARFAC